MQTRHSCPSVTWPASTDKGKKQHETPLTKAAVAALKTHKKKLARIGTANVWVFPGPKSAKEPCSRSLVREWWERSALIAKLPSGERIGWHAARRGWASEMRDVNSKDLCDLGGWASYAVPFDCYIKPDLESQRDAFSKRRELHSRTRARLA